MNQRPESKAFQEDRGLAEWRTPSRAGAALFALKVAGLRLKRSLEDFGRGSRRLRRAEPGDFTVLAESITPLWADLREAELAYQQGKVENLRRAAQAIDGTLIPAGGTFSFWKQVGRASGRRGFVTGRMLKGGCLTPAVGGGLCQLSNALHEVALDGGCEIVERHAHSRQVPGSTAKPGRDATVAWNYVDLRFRSTGAAQLEVRLTADELIVRLKGRSGDTGEAAAQNEVEARATARSCATCEETGCFRHEPARPARTGKVWLVDDNPPEFTRWMQTNLGADDAVGLPLDGARWGLQRYRWPTEGASRRRYASLPAILRAVQVRRHAQQGPKRRAAELAGAERIAASLARTLTPQDTELVIAQSLAPFLWRQGRLGGRRYSVLVTRPPMGALQQALDEAFMRDMHRTSLTDYRAPTALVAAEQAALAGAEQLITPHAEVARLFPDKTLLLDWVSPAAPTAASRQGQRRCIAFPGPTAARKGAWAVREAARSFGLEVLLMGSELEGSDFWSGVTVRRPDGAGPWWTQADIVVQPAITEESPRRLLMALAAGVPVVASAACGVASRPGLTLIEPDNGPALTQALRDLL